MVFYHICITPQLLRCRTFRRQGNDVFELNYFNNASTIGSENWYDATNDTGDPETRQPACKHYAQQSLEDGMVKGNYIPSWFSFDF